MIVVVDREEKVWVVWVIHGGERARMKRTFLTTSTVFRIVFKISNKEMRNKKTTTG